MTEEIDFWLATLGEDAQQVRQAVADGVVALSRFAPTDSAASNASSGREGLSCG